MYSREDEISAWKFRKKTVTIMLCLGAPGLGSGDPMLWELRGESVKDARYAKRLVQLSSIAHARSN